MTTRAEEAAVYGFVNGLGYPGDPATKDRLIRGAQRAANRGDWETLLDMGLAYVVGAGLGAYLTDVIRGSGSARW